MSGFEVWFLFSVIPAIELSLVLVSLAFILLAIIEFFAVIIALDKETTKKEKDESCAKHIRKMKNNMWFAVLSLFIFGLIPNQKTMAAIIVVPAITQNERVLKFDNKAMDGAVSLFDQWVNDITKQNDTSKGMVQ